MARGRIKWYSLEKGYGFIEPASGGEELFVHRTEFENVGWHADLAPGTRVEYEVEITPKGLQAVAVERLEEEEED